MLAANMEKHVSKAKWKSGNPAHTFNITMHLSLAVEVLQASQKLAGEDGDVVLSEEPGLELDMGGIEVGNRKKMLANTYQVGTAASRTVFHNDPKV